MKEAYKSSSWCTIKEVEILNEYGKPDCIENCPLI